MKLFLFHDLENISKITAAIMGDTDAVHKITVVSTIITRTFSLYQNLLG